MDHQTVLITGTSSGFGLLTAVALAKQGHYVVATMRDPSKAQRLRTAMGEAGVTERHYEVLQLDVTDHKEVEETVAEAVTRLGRIDVLINNAGHAQGGLVEELPMEKLRRQFETNFFGLVAVTQAVLPSMRERRKGKIINISSISGCVGFPALSAYVSSKHAVEGFSESLRYEMLPFGVHVVLVEPASYKTDIWEKGIADLQLDPSSPYSGLMKTIYKLMQASAKHAGDPNEVISLLLRIVQDDNPKLRYLVGQGTKTAVLAKSLLPSKWIDRLVIGRLKS